MTIEKDKDGTYIAYNVDESPYTLIGRGATVKEAKADFANSMQEIKESEEERGGGSYSVGSSCVSLRSVFTVRILFDAERERLCALSGH